LRDLSYVEGKNLIVEVRSSNTVEERHDGATELTRMNFFSTSSTEAEPTHPQTARDPEGNRAKTRCDL